MHVGVFGGLCACGGCLAGLVFIELCGFRVLKRLNVCDVLQRVESLTVFRGLMSMRVFQWLHI